MSKQSSDVFPPFIPGLRDVRFIEGATALSSDVRLATSNVLPFMRKTMRSVFSSAGIRVVANKKRFVINVNVVGPDELDFSGVPEELREDYYEVDIVDNEVTVRAASQQGSIWGSQTFAHIYSGLGTEAVIPNCRIRDWPHAAVRGVFFESCWGMESLGPEDWGAVMDRLIRSKLNTFGLTLVGSVQNPDRPGLTDIALAKVEGMDALSTPVTLRYYSPQKKDWVEEPTLPRVFEMDTLSNIFSLAREKGLNTVIGVNLPSFARVVGGGAPDEDGFSISDSGLRDKFLKLLDYAAEKCMHRQNPYFLLSLGGFVSDDERKGFVPAAAAVGEWLQWLVPQLQERGLGRLVLWGDEFSGGQAVGDWDDLKKLDPADWTLGCRHGTEGVEVEELQAAGVEIWNVAQACTSNWSRYETCYDAVREIGEIGRTHTKYAQITDAIYDPAWVDHGQLLACYSWNPESAVDMKGLLEQGIKARFGAFAESYAMGMQKLTQCLEEHPALAFCFHRPDDDSDAGRNFPESALSALRDMPGAVDQLKAAVALSKQTRELFADIARRPKDELNDFMAKAAGSLAGEAARIEAVAGCFAVLLAGGTVAAARKPLLAGMKAMEKFKPRFLVPAALANLTPLLNYLDAKS